MLAILRNKMNLKTHFEHIDDSLFVVSLRQPMISENINKQISEVFFNIDKTLNALSENEDYKAMTGQQYTITSTNNLASMLSDILSNLEMQMQPNPGQGQGEMQLPDIIMSQEELEKQADQMLNGEKEGQGLGNQNQNNALERNKDKGSTPGDSSKNGGGSEPDQYSDPEESTASLFQLYKQQQQLRQQLENILKREGLSSQGKNTLESMEKIEQTIVNQGVSPQLLNKMKALKYELLKLEEAALKQGKSSKRQSQTNKKSYRPQRRLSSEEIKLLLVQRRS